MSELDAVVVGAGIVGLAVARRLALEGREVVVLEKAERAGTGASSRNSQVIHAGLYDPPASAKARHCIAGKRMLYRYCLEHGIGHRRLGKLVVAVSDCEVTLLRALERNARACGVGDLKRLDRTQIAVAEPAVRAVEALLSLSTGIVDCHALLTQLSADLEASDGLLLVRHPVSALLRRPRLGLRLENGERYTCRTLVNAAGLGALELAASPQLSLPLEALPRQYYAKGHYFRLSGAAPFRRLIYPLPEPGGLGIHATLDLQGQVRFGPDVLWQAQVDYRFEADPEVYAAAIAGYYPGIDAAALQPDYTGVRTKLSGPGEAPADFCIQGPASHGVAGLVNLFGLESPGLTAALSLAEEVCRLARCAAR